MKITSVNVQAFGKIKNLSLAFGEGVNLLQQTNGFGKSTLCAFIRAMLYGLNYNSKLVDGVRTNDVTRYMPWDSTQKFGGSMEISHQGKNYRIERFFGATARSESLQVVDLSTGKQLDVTNVGEHFLGLTVESYDRSTYLPQEQVELSSNENFDAKLANFVEDSAESYDDVQAKLRAYKKQFKLERGVGGIIPTLEREIFQLQSRLQQCDADARERAKMTEQLKQTEVDLQQIAQQELILTQKLDQLQQSWYQCQPSQADVELAKKIDEVDLQIASVPKSVNDDQRTFDQLLEQKLSLEKLRKKVSPRTKFTICLSVALVVAVTLLLVFEQFVFAGVAGIVAVAIATIFLPKLKGKPTLEQIEQLQKQLVAIASKYVNPNGKTFDQLQKDFWNYLNDYQTALAVREALGEKPKITANDKQIANQLQQTKTTLQQLADQKQQLVKNQHQLQFSLSQPVVSAVEIAEELATKQQLLKEAKNKYDVASKTSELLATAKESLSQAYLPALCQHTEQLLNGVTAGCYKVVADRNFTISLQENGQTKPLSAFSRGVREITLLCFRIALSVLIYGKDIPLLIVDDAFVNFDEQNFVRATGLLKQLSKTTQVIYFTCHQRTGQF